jgi:RimJ/RimL family protein N-acetyltransferase
MDERSDEYNWGPTFVKEHGKWLYMPISDSFRWFTLIRKVTARIDLMTFMEGTNVRLRRADPNDADARFALGTDIDIVKMFGVSAADAKPLTKQAAEQWAMGQANNPNAWVIEVEGRLIGEIKLHSINTQDRRASMAIGIYDLQRLGKGFGTEAIYLLLRHAFTELNLHRVGIRVLAFNQRAIRAYAKCGFKVEGRERETAYVDGEWHDDIMMGLLATEYSAMQDLIIDSDH